MTFGPEEELVKVTTLFPFEAETQLKKIFLVYFPPKQGSRQLLERK